MGLIRGFPPTFETPGQLVRRLLDVVHYGLPDDYYAGQVARLEAVTLEDVQRVAREHLDPEALSIVVVGDRSLIEAPLRELGLPIVHLDYEGQTLE
jgi:predicted Zn-dependent peptidase